MLGRIALVAFVSVIAGAMLGATAAHRYTFLEIQVAAMFGAFVGLVSAPIVVLCIRRKSLRVAIPVAYALPLVAAAVAGFVFFDDPFLAMLATTLVLWVSCVVALFVLPDRWRRYAAHRCQKCGYDVTGVPDARCPECFHVID